MDNEQYRKLNESYDRRLIYHVGQSCGFFVELNYMLDAMLYAWLMDGSSRYTAKMPTSARAVGGQSISCRSAPKYTSRFIADITSTAHPRGGTYCIAH